MTPPTTSREPPSFRLEPPIAAPPRSLRAARCAAWTLLVGLGMISLREAGIPVHNPSAVLLLLVAVSAARDGRTGGLASAAVSVASLATYLALFEGYWGGLDLERMTMMGVVAPVMAWLVGDLRRRINDAIRSLAIAEGREHEAAAALVEPYRTLAEAWPQIVWTAKPDGTVDYYNQRWFDYTGMTLEESQEGGWKATLHPDDLQRCIDGWTPVSTTGTTYEIEYRLRRASDGAYRWHFGRAIPVRDAKGAITKWIGTISDIDDQKIAAEAIRNWELVFRHSGWGALITEPDGRIALANPALERMHGYGPDELIGREVFDLFPPEELEFVHEQRATAERDGRVVFESTHIRKDGSLFPVLVNGMVVRADDGRIAFRVANYMDLSDVRAAEAAHARAEEQFRTVQDASTDPFFLWNITPDPETGGIADAALAYANPAAYRMIGRDGVSARHGSIDDLFPGTPGSSRWPIYHEVYRTGTTRELTFFQESVGVWLRLVVLRAGDLIGVIATDVSATKAAELVLRRSRDDLERIVTERTRDLNAARELAVGANRAKSEFLSRASHELRTPLNSVIGFSNILLKNKHDSLSAAELAYLERIKSNGHHLLGLVNDLLDLSKIEAGEISLELASVSLFDLVNDVRQSLEPRALEMGLILTTDLPREVSHLADLMVITDEQRLRQVLINLVGNAIKYAQAGVIKIRVVSSADFVPIAIEVSDTGPGISPDKLESIFEPFVTASTSAQGDSAIGLGLAISRTLCGAMGYTLSVDSIVGVGSTFRIAFGPLGESSGKPHQLVTTV